jgi:glycosyltransferase involved in cell wall biosynthesis
VKIAAFVSHPIQYFTPLWQELTRAPGVELKVFYYSRHGVEQSFDPGFAKTMAWDVDLLAGHASEFLPRQWPTRDPLDYSASALNERLFSTLRQGWDVVWLTGYGHVNNWLILGACKALGLPLLLYADSNLSADRDKPPWKRAVKRAVLTPFVSNVTAFLAPGDQTRTYFLEYGASPEAIFISPFVVDVASFREAADQLGAEGRAALRKRFDIPPGNRIVAFGGKLVSWKRPGDVVAALEKLARKDVTALFIGDGPLREEIAKSNPEIVRITGFLNRSEIAAALSLADLLVMPSEFEPFGIMVSEAQALGIPCIVSDRCGCYGPDTVLRDRYSGFVYSSGDIEALSGHVGRLLSDPSLYERMSSAARKQGDLQSAQHAVAGFLAAASYAIERRAKR